MPSAAAGYVGPGAGFAFLTSFLAVFASGLLALLSLLLWPVRALIALVRGRRRPKGRVRRLIVLGLDGQDPGLTDDFMRAGKLPNFERLAQIGCYHRLRSTFPSVSPVAWSSFSTGTHPARHNIFDFLDRDRRTYLPVLSSAEIGRVTRVLKLGRFQIPLGRPPLRLLRKSEPFWSILGRYRIWSTVLRVPITFPPDRFYGAQLSAMSVPDLLGTQGTFTLFTTRRNGNGFKEGGVRVPVTLGHGKIHTELRGPPNPLAANEPPLAVPLEIKLNRNASAAEVRLDSTRVTLRKGQLSDWIPVRFRAAPGVAARGICRMMLTELGDEVSLYVTPVNLDPEKPAMPISRPAYYASYLAKKIGPFATLGLAEDTWARNEGVIDDDAFLRMTYDIDCERQEMFFAALDKLRRGSLVCVFDATDRIQHMFWRYLEPGHPALQAAPDDSLSNDGSRHHDAIEQLYINNDSLVGRVLDRVGEDDVLMVISDHGFTSFRRGVNLNQWLLANGYLALRQGADGGGEWLRDVDWSRTRAYLLGLTGLFLNIRGREGQGIVQPGEEARALRAELIAKLSGLVDEDKGVVGIREAFDTSTLYHGPYLENAPDLLIGYAAGYRVSWDCATGVIAGPVFEDNVKPWSGDHCVDPRIVPGIFLCNRPIQTEDPALIDIAPSALWLFGIEPPPHMDGEVLFREEQIFTAEDAEDAEHSSPQSAGGVTHVTSNR